MFDNKILIVDDELDILEPFTHYLKMKGFKNAFPAEKAQEALDIIERQRPELILLDIQLNEDIDGMEILKRTKEGLSPDSEVVMISGYKDEYEDDAFKLGARDFWKKPLMPNQIFENIKKVFDYQGES